MAIIVEHDKRRHEILEKSLELFCREGYEDVTFQKISDACGITRTTLYIYFKNKREIFLWSIKQLTMAIEKKLQTIIDDKSLNAEQCLRTMITWIIDECGRRASLFHTLLPYLISLQKSGINPGERVRRRVLRVKHLFNTIIIRGINDGEFKKNSVKDINDLFYSQIEAAIFHIAILDCDDTSDMHNIINLAIDGLLTK